MHHPHVIWGSRIAAASARREMDVTFETAAGRRFTVEIWFFSTVRRIKEYVERQEGIAAESQRLFFAGAEMDDNGDTERYSILQGSTVLLLLPEDGAAPAPSGGGGGGTKAMVRVVVNAPAALAGKGGAVTLEVDAAACTVAGLKERVQERTDGALPAARVALMFGKVEMEDGRAVAEYVPPGAVDGMATVVVSAVVRPPPQPAAASPGAVNKKRPLTPQPQQQQQQQPPRVTVNVKWGAKAAAVEVSDMLAVKDLRAELVGGGVGSGAAAHLPLPMDGGYFFIYKQNVMEEDRTLRWHDVKNGDTIEIFNGRVTGGA
uniref:Ubiquitin-like domain-containing protein n=1 Tax=Oryza punctata TaxID=4537 RepID=A0A0E0MLB1_ORYPU